MQTDDGLFISSGWRATGGGEIPKDDPMPEGWRRGRQWVEKILQAGDDIVSENIRRTLAADREP